MARKGFIQLPGFEGVEEGGGSFHIPEGDYLMKCTGVTPAVSKASGNDMLVFTFTGLQEKSKNKRFWLYCSYTREALWKLRQTLVALGVSTPDDPSELNPDDVVDVEVIGTVTDNEYDGKTNSKVTEIAAVDASGARVPAAEQAQATAATAAAPIKMTPAGNGKPAAKLLKIAASEIEDMDEDELEEINTRYDLDIDLSQQKTKRRKANAVIAAMQAAKMLEA
jgi:hypothetical protein